MRLAVAQDTVALHHDLGDRLQVVSARPGPGSLGIRLPLRHPLGYICGQVAAIALCVDSPQLAVVHQHQTIRSEEHTSELQSLMRISYAVFCLKKKKTQTMT